MKYEPWRITNRLYWKWRYVKEGFLCRFWLPRRHHIVRTGLRPGWWDTDYRLEAAIITLFRDFIEKEKPYEIFDTEASVNAKEWAEIRELYEWAKTYDVNNPPYDSVYDDFKGTRPDAIAAMALLREEDRLRGELTEKLCRIIRLRGHYWT